jgi:putative integral membrane protein (TIGR02587 family)
VSGVAAERPASPWADEGLALVRAASGGLLFGVPLLYTMEVWWIGSHTGPAQLLLLLGLLAVPLLALNATSGFRERRDASVAEVVEDTVEALAVGIVMTAAVLFLLRRITVDTPMAAALGQVVNECVPFCLGVGVARFLLQGDPGLADDDGDSDGDGDDSSVDSSSDEADLDSTVADIGATALGAIFIGLSIAPTDEVPMLAAAMSPVWLVIVLAASLVVSYSVVFVAGFAGQDRRHEQTGLFQRPHTETLITYVVALLVAATLLWVFQRDLGPPADLLARIVVLGLPTAVGGAVGRLAL